VSVQVPPGGYTVRYTINGENPDTTSDVYTHPFQVHSNDTLRAAVFLPSGKHSRVRTAVFRSLPPKPPAEAGNLQPGILVTLFTGDIITLDSFDRMKQVSSFLMDSIAIPGSAPKDTFGLLFNGFIQVSADGLYTFFMASDDGSRLWVADTLLINADGIHGPSEESGTIALRKGFHSFRLQYFERFYGESLMLQMQGPDSKKRNLSKGMLWH
jgi:hexosaminidase